jgi:hemoglobin
MLRAAPPALLLAASVLVLTACATSKPAPTPDPAPAAPAGPGPNAKLFDRLGGKPAIEAVVDDFLARVAGDERINAGFAGSDVPRLRQRLVELFCAGTGGGCTYSGRDMKTVHAGMGITAAQFDALAGHLVATLDKFKVPEKEKGELLAIVGPMKKDIVEGP